jgi:Ni,Fe-hydrogenase III small subunit/NAD-dependent dihydropyrimidine dehydrogenase PreA subunit
VFRILARSARTGIVTSRDPFARSPGARTTVGGLPALDAARCTACGECVSACPTGALQVTQEIGPRRTVSLSYGQCIECRECLPVCPEQALVPTGPAELVAYTRAQLTHRVAYDVDAEGRATFAGEASLPGPSLAQSAAALRARVRGRLGRSLHVRQVDAGSCNGCELEITATTNPVFDLERFGIHFVASPRHADLLLVTGPVTRNMEIALRRTLEAAPEPRVVVAVGACGCSSGLFGERTYASLGGVDRVLPVDVYVPGCPPSPRAILAGLLTAMDRREARGRPQLPPRQAATAAADGDSEREARP